MRRNAAKSAIDWRFTRCSPCSNISIRQDQIETVLVEPQPINSFQIRTSKPRHLPMQRPAGVQELLRHARPSTKHGCPNGPSKHQMGYPCITRGPSTRQVRHRSNRLPVLMDGSHPYDCRIDEAHNAEANSRKEKIIKNYFPYSVSKPSYIHVNNPGNANRYSNLPKEVKDLFERAFGRA